MPGEEDIAVVAKVDVVLAFIGCVWVVWLVCEDAFVLGFGEVFLGTAAADDADVVENCAEAVMAEGEIAPVVVLDFA